MESITLHSHVGADGVLDLKVPVGIINSDVQVVVVFEVVTPAKKTPANLGYPSGFFEQTFGALRDEPLAREQPAEYETRKEIK